MSAKSTVGLGTWLALLVIGAVVPLLVFAGATLFQISKDSQMTRDQGQLDTARALALAVDGEVRSWKTALMALATSQSLQQGRLAEFYEQARQVALQHAGWIVLTDMTMQQRINTLRPYGDPLPKTSSPETMQAIFTDGNPMVTDLVFGKVSQRFLVAVAVPVRREGKVEYVLDMSFGPERLTRLLQDQQLPTTWVSAINDRQHRVVARSRDAETRVGKPVVEWFAAATRKADSGIVDGPLIDGRQGQIAFQRLKEVPWVVALAIPVAELPSRTPLVLFLIVGAVMGCAAVGLAVYIGRKITAPIARLADAGGLLVRGEAVEIGASSGIREVRELQQALGEASAAVQGYYQERERAAVAVETAKVATAAEQALRASEERLKLFIQNAPAAIAMFDRDMRYLAVSRRWMTDYGLGDRDIVGQSHYEVFPEIPESWKTVHQRGLTGEVVQATEDRFQRMDGTVQWLRWEVRPWRNADGTVGGIMLFTEDITQRRRAEEEIRSLAKFSSENPSPVLRTSVDGTILYANLASLPLLETWKTGKERILPQPWRESVRQVYAAGMPRELEAASGERVFSMILVPIRDAGYVNLYGRDITDRKRAEAALRKAHDELELRVRERTAELSEAIQTLEDQSEQLRALASELTLAEQRERRRLATVLHDEHQQLLVGVKLRMSPLERVKDPTVREACKEILSLLEEAIEHARSLTRELSPPILHAGGLLPALNWLARWMKEKHHLTIDLRIDETAVPETEDLIILLFQSVRELLFNVVKHAKVPTARLEITRRDGQVQLIVSDAGVGFDPPSLRIEDGGAAGFGLFSIRQRLELLGGRMEIDSSPGQGSRVTLWAPLRGAEATVLPVSGQPGRPESTGIAAGAPPAHSRTGKIRVLVVDDHKVVRQALANLLKAEPDIEIVGEAADGQTAVTLTRQLSPDVVTMDISMPGMNGIEATRVIHAECPAVQVIGLSMFEEAEQAKAMRNAGAVDYLSKGAASDALLATIRACTESRRQGRGQ